jgi:hypothetical protein
LRDPLVTEEFDASAEAIAWAKDLAETIADDRLVLDRAKTGDACPQSGVWEADGLDGVRVTLRRGDFLPPADEQTRSWSLAQPFDPR